MQKCQILGFRRPMGFKQNQLARPGGYPPIEAIFMKRKKVIEQILRNLHFSAKKGKYSPRGGPSKAPEVPSE